MRISCQPVILGLLMSLLAGPFGLTAVARSDTGSGSGPLSKLTVHGFLSQGYATASFAEGGFISPILTEKIFGIPEDGTSAYRNLALQFRYEISPRDTMIIQLSNRQLGVSPIREVEDEIELDWAFYQHRFGDTSVIKVGRIQIPFGIFNEVRDVGTILPFWRPAYAFYNEGTFTTETVDGFLFGHTFLAESNWSTEFSFYYGEYELAEINPTATGEPVALSRAEDAVGFQLWLSTPISGLRFGLGANQRDVSGGLPFIRGPGVSDQFESIYGSIDLALEKFVFRAEYVDTRTDPGDTLFGGVFSYYYVQLGYHPTEKIRIYVQAEFQDVDADKEDFRIPFGIPATEDFELAFYRDFGVALNYMFSANIVLKAEHHFDVESEQFGFMPVFTPGGPALQPIYATAEGGEYSIISLSVSF